MFKTFNNPPLSLTRLVIAALVALLFQIAVLPFIPGMPAIDLFGALLIAASFQYSFRRIAPIAVGGGIIIDGVALLAPIGISALLYAGIIGGTVMAGRFFHIRSFSVPAISIIVVATIVLHGIVRLIMTSSGIEYPDLIGTAIAGLLFAALLLRS